MGTLAAAAAAVFIFMAKVQVELMAEHLGGSLWVVAAVPVALRVPTALRRSMAEELVQVVFMAAAVVVAAQLGTERTTATLLALAALVNTVLSVLFGPVTPAVSRLRMLEHLKFLEIT
jgi:hypothetical protein